MPIQTAVIADDEVLNRELLAEMLPRLGVTVRTAQDDVYALRVLESERNKVYVPGMDCLQVPMGTALGVFTFVVLLCDPVRAMYENRPAQSWRANGYRWVRGDQGGRCSERASQSCAEV